MDDASRRRQLWALLGELPQPGALPTAEMLRRERHPGFTLERLKLDLNGVEPVPAILLIPDRRATPAPGLLFMHWHGGQYGLGKEQLLQGCDAQAAWAPVCAELGLVTLAIDSWCFGKRCHDTNGRRGEEDTFKRMLWHGQVLWGMMLFDEFRALNYLAGRPEVAGRPIGATGLSMGATKAWWLSALDPRIVCTVDFCCLTDYQALMDTGGLSRHGIYYYVPSLLRHFDAGAINALIAPRPRLSLNGRRDPLSPAEGVEKIRKHVLAAYGRLGADDQCRIELFDAAHEETPAMRAAAQAFLQRHLIL